VIETMERVKGIEPYQLGRLQNFKRFQSEF
jgi:hypothetical protein